MKNILSNASDLKYMTMTKKAIAEQFQAPSDRLIKAIINKNIYSGSKTQAILDKFRIIIKKAFEEYTNELITERISNAIGTDSIAISTTKEKTEAALTLEEIKILDYIKNIINPDINLVYKKTSRYAYMQIGELSTKWICRLYIRKAQHLFTLHKFDDTNYECEYYFDSVEQLGTIKDLIQDTYNKCCKTQ